MLRLGFRPTSRFALGLATLPRRRRRLHRWRPADHSGGGTAGTSATGSAGADRHRPRAWAASRSADGAVATTGTGGTLPVPPGCGDGINNQGGIEDCDDGNTVAGDGCNGICHVEPNWNCPSAGACSRENRLRRRHDRRGRGVRRQATWSTATAATPAARLQDPAYTCMPGSACIRSSICGEQARRAGRELRRRQRGGERRLRRELPAGARVGLPGARLAVHARGALRRRHRQRAPGRGVRRRQHHRGRRLLGRLQDQGRRLLVRSRACDAPAPRSAAATAPSRATRSATTATPTAATAARRPARSSAATSAR